MDHKFPPHQKRLLKPKEAAGFFGMSERWLRDSSVPKVLLPGIGQRCSVRYDLDELVAYARRHLTHSITVEAA
jgi:hypothetical protein